MKKNGFTLLELLIGISLISIVMVFLFRLLYDIQNESISNTYITANQTNRDEMISNVTKIMHDNGQICRMVVDSLSEGRVFDITFCNSNTLQISSSRQFVSINYGNKKYRYMMKDEDAFYSPDANYVVVTLGDKSYLKINIKTSKKGMKNNNIDDIEFMGEADNIEITGRGIGDFIYTGSSQSYIVPQTGYYKIEVWGAAGSRGRCDGSLCGTAGKGAYSAGVIRLVENEVLYVYVGQKAPNAIVGQSTPASYNGGGGGSYDGNDDETGGGGGGATDVRLVDGAWNNSASLASRIIVAGGGGGTSYYGTGGSGGGLAGLPGSCVAISNGATQTTGYQFGVGRTGVGEGPNSDGVAGGGGGYWGGTTVEPNAASGSGGSGYVSGHIGCVAIKSATDTSPSSSCNELYNNKECSIHYSGRYFYDTVLIDGNSELPTHDGLNTMVGNSGDGYAKITYLPEYETNE